MIFPINKLRAIVFTLVIAIVVMSLMASEFVRSNYTSKKMARIENCPATFRLLASENESQKGLAFIGDSRAWEWGLWLDDHANYSVFNMAVPGETSPETVCRMHAGLPEEVGFESLTVVLSLGINDLVTASLHQGARREQIERQALENIFSILSKLTSKHENVVLLTVVPPINTDPLRAFLWGQDIAVSVTKLNEKVATNLPAGVTLLDAKDVFLDASLRWREDLARDALHWNNQAYSLLTDRLQDVVAN